MHRERLSIMLNISSLADDYGHRILVECQFAVELSALYQSDPDARCARRSRDAARTEKPEAACTEVAASRVHGSTRASACKFDCGASSRQKLRTRVSSPGKVAIRAICSPRGKIARMLRGKFQSFVKRYRSVDTWRTVLTSFKLGSGSIGDSVIYYLTFRQFLFQFKFYDSSVVSLSLRSRKRDYINSDPCWK